MIINLNVGKHRRIVSITTKNQPGATCAEGVMKHYQIGDSIIFKISECEMHIPVVDLYPDSTAVEAGEAHQPVSLSVHSWVVRTPDDIIVIDTGIGNGRDRGNNPLYHQLHTSYLENLRASGIEPEAVTLVLMTHLHTDHVGWNTFWQENRWVPLFPNARYICSEKELSRVKNSERYRNLWLDSLLPVIEAGLLETINVAEQPVFGGRIHYVPTPGHSPDHAALILSSGGKYAFFTGDIAHSPLQFSHPEWNSVFCSDHQQAEKSRRWAMAWCEEHHALWCSAHFPGESCGWLTVDRHGNYALTEAEDDNSDA